MVRKVFKQIALNQLAESEALEKRIGYFVTQRLCLHILCRKEWCKEVEKSVLDHRIWNISLNMRCVCWYSCSKCLLFCPKLLFLDKYLGFLAALLT